MAEPRRRWRVLIARQAGKVIERLQPRLRRGILRAIHALATDPRPHKAEALKGRSLYKIPVGDWRIVYAIEDEELVILVISVAPRGSAYREL